ncbi:MAG: hypothetical protein WA359_05505 [Acidimicrobiales bacterium]
MQHFLLVYDHTKQELIGEEQFTEKDTEAATNAYQQAENKNGNNPNIEIVLIGADSIEIVMRTHGHYFLRTTDKITEYLTSA